jgi:tetratricopeptide (TPR) repeat protein
MKFLLQCTSVLVAALCLAVPTLAAPQAPTRGWQGTIELPTYLLGEQDPFPPFGIANPHHVYPYTMLDDLTDRRENKTYRAIFIENEYLKATILPDVGGRLYSLYDKVAQREVFYRNQVVKYGLVALRGAWISGGIEFNFPNGHTVVTVSPVDSNLVQNTDGSVEARVGGIDRITGMHWEVALILRPDESRLEQRVTLFNNTPSDNLYWYWANAAVPATTDMQFMYPMREVNPHSPTEIWTYPVWKGVDYSWYKNILQPTSLFGLGIRRDYFGAYYHNSDYGVVHSADYREVPGKKVWSWGVADDGLIWTDLLTDQDGPYNEIQSGRFETQLYREFLPPQRVQSWTEYWYPVRALGGGFVEANRDLALNVGGSGSALKLSVYSNVNDAGGVLRVKAKGRLLREIKPLQLHASKTVSYDVDVSPTDRKDVEISIESGQGRPLLNWSADQPVDGNHEFVSRAGVHPIAERTPDQMSVQELYLRGVQQEKEGSDEAAVRTFEEVVKRDEANTAALLKLAWWNYRAADFQEAEKLLDRALKRDTTDPQVLYVAGVVRRAEGRLDAAEDSLWSGIRFGGDPSSSLLQLGEISIQKKNYAEAEHLLRRALDYDSTNALAWSDLSIASCLNGNAVQGRKAAQQAVQLMPLLPHARAASRAAAEQQSRQPDPIVSVTDNALAVAGWLQNLGDFATSDRVLEEAAGAQGRDSASPMIFYYLASNAWKQHRDAAAKESATKAAALSTDKVFPQTLSDAATLRDAIAQSPSDTHANYLLGNFLFAHGKYDAGVDAWKRAQAAGFEDAGLERNLAIYAWRVKGDLRLAADAFEKAVRLAPAQYRLYPELDEVYAQLQQNEQRAKLFESAPASVLQHDTVIVRRALLLVEERQFDAALQVLSSHRFKPWEGGRIVRDMFVLANLEKGRLAMKSQQYSAAEQAFRRALEYPVNLGVGRPHNPDDTEAFYWLGEALSKAGKTSEATAAWTSAAEAQDTHGSSAIFRALALQKLGNKAKAATMLQNLADVKSSGSAQEFYVAGLAERFRGQEQIAESYFQQALTKDPGMWNARFALRGE